jgi:hypothetical protein
MRSSSDKNAVPPPVFRRFVRREWNIYIECSARQAVVYPGGTQIPSNSLGGTGTNGGQLFQTIQQMITRRQAVIASSDNQGSSQLPQIRFLVRPDGLRTYFLAFPELTPLQAPMTRENIDADEDVVRHMAGR